MKQFLRLVGLRPGSRRRRRFMAAGGAALAAIVLALFGLPGGSADASRALRFPEVHAAVLSNGLRTFAVEHDELPLVSVRVVIDGAGSVADPMAKAGLADLVGETLTRGAAARDAEAYADAVERLGGVVLGRANVDEAYVEIQGAARDLDALLALLADAVIRPTLAPTEVDRLIRTRVAELRERYDRPGLLASDGLLRWVYGDHPYGHPLGGTVRGVRACTPVDVSELYAAHYAPGSAFVVVAGDIEAHHVVKRLEHHFGDWEGHDTYRAPRVLGSPATPARGRTVIIVDRPEITQVSVKLAVPGLSRSKAASSYGALMVSNTILTGGFTSRLVDRLRVDMGLVYSIDSGFEMNVSGGYFDISTSTKKESVRELVDETMKIVTGFIRTGPTDIELASAKAYLRGGFPLEFETPEGLSAAVHEQVLHRLPADWAAHYLPSVAAVTPEDARRVLRELFEPGRVGLILVGPAKELKKDLAGWAKRIVVKRHDRI